MTSSIVFRAAAVCCLVAGSFAATAAQAGSLPPPSRTVYKCVVDGKAAYSDAPCLGAQRLDIEPTRGLDRSTGKIQTGHDVQAEKTREQLVEALKPLIGTDVGKFDRSVKRQKLSANAKYECSFLDSQVSDLEHEERNAAGMVRVDLPQSLFAARDRYRQLGC